MKPSLISPSVQILFGPKRTSLLACLPICLSWLVMAAASSIQSIYLSRFRHWARCWSTTPPIGFKSAQRQKSEKPDAGLFFDVDAIPRSCQPPYIPFTINMRHNFAQLPPFWVNSNHQSFVLLGRRENCIISFHSKVSNAPTFIAGCANSKCHCQ